MHLLAVSSFAHVRKRRKPPSGSLTTLPGLEQKHFIISRLMAGGIRLRVEAGLFSLPGRSLLRDEVFLQPSIMANVY